MVVIWLLLGPLGMIVNPPKEKLAGPTTTISATSPTVVRRHSETEPPPSWIPVRIGQYGSEKYLARADGVGASRGRAGDDHRQLVAPCTAAEAGR